MVIQQQTVTKQLRCVLVCLCTDVYGIFSAGMSVLLLVAEAADWSADVSLWR